jgi:host factor-I protein
LNHARRERILLGFQLLDGRRFDARIKNFDRFAVIVELDGRDELVFKHAIASIASDRAVANYFAHHS